jgi:hypothetical protein
VIYIDNISRANFHRKMPHVVNWLNNFASEHKGEYETFEYFKYHGVFHATYISNNALNYGQKGMLKDLTTSTYESFSKNGYVTGFTNTGCEPYTEALDESFGPETELYAFDHDGMAMG